MFGRGCQQSDRKETSMEKKVNGAWLFFILLLVLLAVVFMMTYVNPSTDSYSGGMLVERSAATVEPCFSICGGQR